MNKNKRDGTVAEKAFDHFCSPWAVCTEPDQDEYGWDRMLEVPRRLSLSDLGTEQFIQRIFIQIKSTSGSSRSVRIKLSNMERACHEDKPWFIFLTQYDPTRNNSRYFIKHVWGSLFADTLKECRRKAVENRLLHKSKFAISFLDADEVAPENIVKTILDEIDSVGSNYSLIKKELYNTLGYEHGRGILSIRFDGLHTDALLKEMLGAGEGLRASSFSMTAMRFGILDPVSSINGAAGNIHISPTTLTKCVLTVQGPVSESPLDLPGHLYGADVPGLTDDKIIFRVSAPPVELICVDGENVSLSMKLDGDAIFPLQHFISFATIFRWGSNSGINISVRIGNNLLFKYLSSLDRPKRSLGAVELGIVSEAVLSVLNHRGIHDFCCSADDLRLIERDLFEFAGLTKASPLEIRFECDIEIPSEIDSILYFVSILLSGKAIQAIIRRPLISDHSDEGWRTISFGHPTIVRGYYSENSLETAISEVVHDIRRLTHELATTERPFTLETEMIAMVRSMTRVDKWPNINTYQANAHAIQPVYTPKEIDSAN